MNVRIVELKNMYVFISGGKDKNNISKNYLKGKAFETGLDE